MDDSLLIRKFCSDGDGDAAVELLGKHQRALYQFIWQMLHNSQDCEDAMQKTFSKTLFALPRYREENHFKSWLFRIGRKEAIEIIRRRRRTVVVEADSKLSAEIEALLEKDPAAQRYLDELDRLNALRDELAGLPVMNRSRSFVLEAVTERLVERKVTRFPLAWIAAAVIAVIAVGAKSWFYEGTSQAEEVVAKEEKTSSETATRAKLSKRLFSTRPKDSALERISIARARKLRTELNHLPNF